MSLSFASIVSVIATLGLWGINTWYERRLERRNRTMILNWGKSVSWIDVIKIRPRTHLIVTTTITIFLIIITIFSWFIGESLNGSGKLYQFLIGFAIVSPLIILSSIVLEWYIYSVDSFQKIANLPHRYLAKTLYDLEEEGYKFGQRYGRYLDSLSTSFELLKRFNSPHQETAAEFLISLNFEVLPSHLLTPDGDPISFHKEPLRSEDFRCFDITVNIDGYVSFVEYLYAEFSGYYTTQPSEIRIFSPFQPYEWFHNPKGGGGITYRGSVNELMKISNEKLENYERCRRYIPSTEQMVSIQRKLYIVQQSDNWRPQFDAFRLAHIENNPSYIAQYPFTDSDRLSVNEIEDELFFWVVTEDQKDQLPEEYTAISLLDNFCFGSTYFVHRDSFCMDENYDGDPSTRLDGIHVAEESFATPFSEILTKSEQFSTRKFDELIWVGKPCEDTSSILSFGVDILPKGYVNICAFPTINDSRHFAQFFNRLDNLVDSDDDSVVKIGTC